ncbi:MAG: adenylosuccinate lyase [Ignavibacteria bacterium]|nr:adenylosuccinate lyase [Ignavibacteria bacterium]
MISRYTLPAMAKIWTDENKFKIWLDIEILICEALAKEGKIPLKSLNNIKRKAKFDINRINELEKVIKHDVIAFLTNVAENVGPDSRFIHIGITSSDILDTTLAVQMKQAGEIILKDLNLLKQVLKEKAKKYKYLPQIGRTHGVHAEPITLGLKFANWYDEVNRNIERMKTAIDVSSVGMISGAVGTYSYLSPKIEEYVCRKLKLKPCKISSQIISRDIHCQYINTLAIIGTTLEKIALEIRHLQRTEVLELEESFTKGQKGSSAMPHKKNPITAEQICGLARILRANTIPALENVALWHERDISHSSAERVIFPDSTILLDYTLNKTVNLLKYIVVNKNNISNNLSLLKGLYNSQYVMLKLTEKGLTREESYKIVQDIAMKCWNENLDFKNEIYSNKKIREYLSENELNDIFDLKRFFKNIDYIYSRLNL